MNMPTSSQAMILKNREIEENMSIYSSLDRPCPVSSVDLNELFDQSCKRYGEKIMQNFLLEPEGKIKEKLTKILERKGFRTCLSYDPINGSLCWKFTPLDNKDIKKDRGLARPKTSVPGRNLKKGKENSYSDSRSKSANFFHRTYTYADLPEKILSLGFRRQNKVKTRRNTKSAPALVNKCKIHFVEDVDKQMDPETKEEEKNLEESTSEDELKERKTTENPTNYEETSLPSVYLRKYQSGKQPLAVCFSLHDNEALSHFDLKKYVETETGVKIMKLQYEPLSIRSGDPSINGRWVATVRNLFEVDTIVRKGFFLDGYHIIVKHFNEITEREYRNYQYLKDIRNEKKKLNLPSSSKSTGRYQKI